MFKSVKIWFLLAVFGFVLVPGVALGANEWVVSRVTTDGSQQSGVIVDDDLIVWADWRGPLGIDIWGYNLVEEQEYLVLSEEGNQSPVALNDDKMLYNDGEDIWVIDLISSDKQLVATGEGSRAGGGMDGDWVVYTEGYGSGAIMAYNLRTEERVEITDEGAVPKVSGNKVVWYFNRGGGLNGVRGYDLGTRSFIELMEEGSGNSQLPDVENNKVVWAEDGEGYSRLIMKDLGTGVVSVVREISEQLISYPTIYGNRVAWRQVEPLFREGEGQAWASIQNVWVNDLGMGEVTQITDYEPQMVSPAAVPSLYGNRVAWKYWNTGNGDIYMAEQQVTDVRLLLQQIIDLAKQAKKDKLIKGYERANITRPVKHALRDLRNYEKRLAKGREEAALDRLKSFYEELAELEENLEEILNKRPGREELVDAIRELLEKIRAYAPPLNPNPEPSPSPSPSPSPAVVVGADLSSYVQPVGDECDIKVPEQYPSIQAGVDASSTGNTVCVGSGIYNENININKSVRLSGRGASETTIDTGSSSSIAVYITTSDVTLEGFQINGVSAGWGGVAVYADHTVLGGVVVQSNHIRAGNGSGALRALGSQMVQNNVFEGNNSVHLVNVSGTPVKNNTFIGSVNKIDRQDSGIALIAEGRGSQVTHNIFNVTGDILALLMIRNEFDEAAANFNNFNAVGTYTIMNSGAWDELNAENNWWGDLDPSDNNRGLVDYEPFALLPYTEN